jgi:hypothetical protein
MFMIATTVLRIASFAIFGTAIGVGAWAADTP